MPDSNSFTRSQPWVNGSERYSTVGATQHKTSQSIGQTVLGGTKCCTGHARVLLQSRASVVIPDMRGRFAFGLRSQESSSQHSFFSFDSTKIQ